MQGWLRLLLIASILFNTSSFVWFLLGSTAYLQRGMDIIGTAYLWAAGVPVLFVAGSFTVLLLKGWTPTSRGGYISVFIGVVFTTVLSAALINSVSTHSWANKKIESDSVQITSDEKYEYRIDLINLFQRNSHARLYLKDVDSGEEMYIPVDIQTHKIVGLGVGRVNHWVRLEPTENSSQYILYTTEELGIPEERFIIDISAGTANRMN